MLFEIHFVQRKFQTDGSISGFVKRMSPIDKSKYVKIKFNNSIKSIFSLLYFKYDCFYAPFEFNDLAYSWWNDKDGSAKFYWAGANTNNHTCQCGIDKNCVEPLMKCNCDSTVPEQLFDSGKMNFFERIYYFKI